MYVWSDPAGGTQVLPFMWARHVAYPSIPVAEGMGTVTGMCIRGGSSASEVSVSRVEEGSEMYVCMCVCVCA
jgi:hypothetical protein